MIGYSFQVRKVFYYFSFSAFKLFSSLTDLIGDVRLICTFRLLCGESDFVLSALLATIFRKYLLSVLCVVSFAIVGDVVGGHSLLFSSWLGLERDIWPIRPSVGVVWMLLLAILSADFCEFCSNRIFLPITVLDKFLLGAFDDRDDDDDDVETLDAVDIRNDAASSSSLRLLKENN